MSWYRANRTERSTDRLLVTGEERCHRESKIGEDHRVLGKLALAQCLLALAGQHKNRLRPDRLRRLQVADRIADARHSGQLDAEPLADLGEHPRLGLAAIAIRFGRVRAEEHGIDAAAHLRERLVELV